MTTWPSRARCVIGNLFGFSQIRHFCCLSWLKWQRRIIDVFFKVWCVFFIVTNIIFKIWVVPCIGRYRSWRLWRYIFFLLYRSCIILPTSRWSCKSPIADTWSPCIAPLFISFHCIEPLTSVAVCCIFVDGFLYLTIVASNTSSSERIVIFKVVFFHSRDFSQLLQPIVGEFLSGMCKETNLTFGSRWRSFFYGVSWFIWYEINPWKLSRFLWRYCYVWMSKQTI